MSAGTAAGITWPALVANIAEIGHVAPEAVVPSALLVDDLGLDSLALAELVMALDQAGAGPALADGAEARDWSTVTAGALLELATGGAPAGG